MQIINYYLIRLLGLFFSLFSFKALYKIADLIHSPLYLLIGKYRKRALSNLSCATELNLCKEEIKKIAKESLFHLLLTSFEYGKLYYTKTLHSFVKTVNADFSNHRLDQDQGVVFFCGHQSNWELLFLDATSRHAGVCIGKPIRNKRLYDFILKIREKFGGKVVEPKDAYKTCLRALKKGQLVGVVGDQGMPESNFVAPCFGRNAHSTTLPALLSLRSNCPLIVAMIERNYGSYTISYSDPIELDPKASDPVFDLTQKSLKTLDAAIKKNPAQWMWQHNRWKISYPSYIPKKFRHDAICIIVPDNKEFIDELSNLLETYKGAYWIGIVPLKYKKIKGFNELFTYQDPKDCFIEHYGPKLVFDGVGIEGLKKHFKKMATFTYCEIKSPKKILDSWKTQHAN
jgi:KDO2-lipid IV(A) lauroyltransferase